MSPLHRAARLSLIPTLCSPLMLCGQVFTPGAGVTDVDGNEYTSVVYVNGQEWMAANLRTTRYANGDSLIHAPAVFEWQDALGGAWCHYANDTANDVLHGKLYNAGAVRDERGVCPSGWHVPTAEDWAGLALLIDPAYVPVNTIVQSATAGGAMKEVGTQWWTAPNAGATNAAGFSGRGSGTRNQNGTFISMGVRTRWWSSEATANYAQRYWEVGNATAELRRGADFLIMGHSIRCIKDDISTGATVTDRLSSLQLFPVPVAQGMDLTVSGHAIGSTYRLLTVDGRIVRTGNLAGHPTTITSQGLDAGSYILQVEGALPMRFTVVQ
ncbi:MAG: hypothetical protein JNL52_06135 [Flavobacteriales bacterium]|nr:hypothetical protein [Flavobacteriales bacterium]